MASTDSITRSSRSSRSQPKEPYAVPWRVPCGCIRRHTIRRAEERRQRGDRQVAEIPDLRCRDSRTRGCSLRCREVRDRLLPWLGSMGMGRDPWTRRRPRLLPHVEYPGESGFIASERRGALFDSASLYVGWFTGTQHRSSRCVVSGSVFRLGQADRSGGTDEPTRVLLLELAHSIRSIRRISTQSRRGLHKGEVGASDAALTAGPSLL